MKISIFLKTNVEFNKLFSSFKSARNVVVFLIAWGAEIDV